ncbi:MULTISPECIES: phthiocerol/phthiodiolone dimycocerosyl transferase family protein [Nocardiopsidaceae]|uniref:Phthiocerol/phthiodiolone dimycocerosyl transferase n=1 Tax=Streptomonospora nanhaiensis TaxID=1323731 RepID=A0ABY6YLI9_9ACTN|nr:peptide synthetase [Streptomonospora nanhaiensis]WAE73229.1 peptide synthetase [Streptomonospora nanhaiensis]
MDTSQGRTVRPLGAFERTIDLYMHRNPVQFSLVAELSHRVLPGSAAAALAVLRVRHPLLGVAVDRTAPQAVFRAADGPIPLEAAADGTPWQSVVAVEQTRPIPPEPGPLVRAVLVPGEPGSTVVLTFAHQIADGVGGLRALLDLVAALGGEEPAPGGVPEAQEDLLARSGGAAEADGPAAGPPPENDARMDAPGELTPFSGSRPHVDALALDRGLTARLVRRCRRERASVHAALCAAAAVVFHRRGREYVRVLSPVDLRRAAGLPDEVAVRFAGARTGSDVDGAGDFWQLARRTRAALSLQRTPDALRAGAAAIAGQPPSSSAEAEAMMASATAADVQITNLGVADPGPGMEAVTALWGPAQTTQLRGEHVLGVVTVGGRLRMTELTHDPVAGLVPEMGAVLAEACAEPPGA